MNEPKSPLPAAIDELWERRAELSPADPAARAEVVRPWSVCVNGMRSRKFAGGEYGPPCVLVLKRLAEGERHNKAELNAILRDHGVDG